MRARVLVLWAVSFLAAAGCERVPRRPLPQTAPPPKSVCPLEVTSRESDGRLIVTAGTLVMGGVPARVHLSGETRESAPPGLHALAVDEIRRVEGELSSYDARSEIRRLSDASAGTWVALGANSVAVLSLARAIHDRTGGAFDVTVGPLVRAYGFHRDEPPSWPPEEELAAARARVGMDRIELDPAGSRARTLVAGMWIDTSAIAKGYAVDRAAEVLRSKGVAHALVEIGGEMVAVGPRAPGRPWTIVVESPRALESTRGFATEIALPTPGGLSAVATSADTYQHFEHGGRRYSHIIDPRTGLPRTGGVVSATVLARDCATADGLATALCVLQADEGVALVEGWPDIEALLLVEDARGALAERRTSGFPAAPQGM